YARVSTAAQDETGQVRQLKAAGCEKVYREKITGTTADRPQLRALMKKLAPGDVVITPAVDRLSRDTTDLLIIAREMQRPGAGIRSLAEPYLDTTSDFAEIVFAILGVAAKLERRRILERTERGRADAKANGGRKICLSPRVWSWKFMEPAPSPQLLRQRIRNNIIAYLEIAASADAQRSYERNVPI